jgi:hypothetical protein
MSVVLALWRLLDRRQRRQVVGLQLLSIVMALSTVGGIAAVLLWHRVPEAGALPPLRLAAASSRFRVPVPLNPLLPWRDLC